MAESLLLIGRSAFAQPPGGEGMFLLGNHLGRREGLPGEAGHATSIFRTQMSLSKLKVVVATNSFDQDRVLTVYKSTAGSTSAPIATGLTLTIPAGVTGLRTSTTDVVTFEVGSKGYLHADENSASSTSLMFTHGLFGVWETTGNETITRVAAIGGPRNVAGSTSFCSLFQFPDWSPLNLGREQLQTRLDLSAGARLRNMQVFVEEDLRTSDTTIRLEEDGSTVGVGMSITIPAADTTGGIYESTDSHLLSTTSLYNWRINLGAGSGNIETAWVMAELVSTDGEVHAAGIWNEKQGGSTGPSGSSHWELTAGTTQYWSIHANIRELTKPQNRSQAENRLDLNVTVERANLYVYHNQFAGPSYMRLQADGVDVAGAPVITIAGSSPATRPVLHHAGANTSTTNGVTVASLSFAPTTVGSDHELIAMTIAGTTDLPTVEWDSTGTPQAMTQLGSGLESVSTRRLRSWRLANPNRDGTSKTLTATYSTNLIPEASVLMAVMYRDAGAPSISTEVASVQGASPSLSNTHSTGDLIIHHAHRASGSAVTTAPSTEETERHDMGEETLWGFFGDEPGTTGAVGSDYTFSSSGWFSARMLRLPGAGGTSGQTGWLTASSTSPPSVGSTERLSLQFEASTI